MRSRILGVFIAATLVLAACAEEDPVGLVGLFPADAVRTIEVILPAEAFLVADTSIGGFSRAADAGFLVVAEDFEGALDAHALARFALPPAGVSFRDTAGTTRTDTLPRLVGGEIVVRVDSLRSRAGVPVRLALFRTAEAWDPRTATWTLRVDSGGVQLPWAQPGGTRGALVDTAVLQPGAGTLTFAVDSTTLALWSDTTDRSRGALVLSETPGVRLRLSSLRLRFQARPSQRPDTVVTDSVGTEARTFVFDPQPAPGANLFVSGTPSWRSFLRLRERLDTLRIATGAADDSIRLSEATINFAALLLQPVAPPPGFSPEDTVVIEARTVLAADEVPLARAPLGGAISELGLPPASFSAGASRVELPITGVLTALAVAPDAGTAQAATTLALIGAPEGALFGLGAFGGRGGAAAPGLRLILSVTSEVQR